MSTGTVQRTVVYNMGPDNPHPMADVQAFAAAGIPRIYLCETQGKRLDPIKGYDLIRDRSTPGRANLAAYVANGDGGFLRYRYVDTKARWYRRQHPGMHPARAILVVRFIGDDAKPEQDVVVHLPPAGADTHRATQETWDAIIRVAAPWRRMAPGTGRYREALRVRRRVLGDLNGSPGSMWVKRARRLLRADQCGHRIDAALVRNWKRTRADYDTVVPHYDGNGRRLKVKGDHRLGTDHPWGALFLRMFR